MNPPPNHATVALIAVALLISAVCLYWPATENELVYFDDTRYVIDNEHVHAGLRPSTVAWAFTTDRMGTWHPITWLSHAADWTLHGDDAGGHHLTSVLLHALNAALLFGLLYRITGRSLPSALVAFVFAVHPLNVSSVAWVSSRKGVLSTTFMLVTLWAYVRYANRPDLKRYIWVLVTFALGLMSKPMLVSLPLVVLLMDVWPLGRMGWNGRATRGGHPWWDKLPLVVMSSVVGGIAFAVRHTGEPVGWSERLAQAPVAVFVYLRRLVWPSDLATPYPPLETPSVLTVALAVVALLGATVIVIRERSTRPYLAVGWLWFVVTLFPVLGIVQVGDQPMADRWMYVPMIGIWIAVAWTVASCVGDRRSAVAVTMGAAVVVVALAVQARAQIRTWRDTQTVFTRAIEVTEGNRVAHYNLGWFLAEQGRTDEAIAHYRSAIEISPRYFAPRYNLAWILWEEGRTDEAVKATCEALSVADPDMRAYRKRLLEWLGERRCP